MSGPSDWPLPDDGVRLTVPQYVLERLKKNPLTRGLYVRAAGYYPTALGHYVRRDLHSDDLFLYCVGGEGTVTVDGANHSVGAGDLMMLPNGVTHVYGANPQRPWTLYWVHFAGEQSKAFWSYLEFNREQPVARVGLSASLAAALAGIVQSLEGDFLESSLIYGSNMLRQVLAQLQMTRLQNRETRSQFSVDTIHEVMRKSLHDELDLNTLAQTANMTRHAFCRRYKAITGVSPYKHYLYLKMKRACHFLDATDQSITEIAELMGYRDPYYFSRIFRQVMGMPPSQYRSRNYG